MPPPGNYFINYFGYYGGELRDGNGNKAPSGEVDAWFNAFRFVHTSEHKILGGNWGWHVIVPLVHQKVDLFGSKSVNGVGDITIDPFIVSWHSKNWHWAIGLDINLPTGRYKEGDARQSIGANYWSYEPLFAFTYMGDTGWEVSAKLMYNIKGGNDDFRAAPRAARQKSDSGDDFHMDYLGGRRFGPWGVGLSGYYLKQTGDDKIDGKVIDALPGVWSRGRRGEVLAAGPSLTYSTKGGTMLIAQWQHEFERENRFGGDKALFKLVMPF